MQRLCTAGDKVQLLELPGVGHRFAARVSASAAVGWIAGRFKADSPPSDCGRMGCGQTPPPLRGGAATDHLSLALLVP
jgi:hypothetical protein